MYIFITILIVLAAILMIFAVLVQKSFASSNQIMGVRKTTDFLEKFTWTLAGTIIVLSILTAKYTTSHSHTPQSQIEVEQPAPLNPSTAPNVTPEIPVPSQMPAQPQPEEGTQGE